MTNLSIIILVGREALHIRRCLEKLAPLEPRQIVVVESQKGDDTHEIAIETASRLGWQVVSCQSLVVSGKGAVVRGQSLSVGNGADLTTNDQQLTTTLHLVWHDWPGNQAAQFNWSLDNLPIEGEWILRLDADEYLTPDTIEKLKTYLCTPTPNTYTSPIAGLTLELRRRFCGGEIRHATNGIRQVRLFRRGKARYAEGLMDERLDVDGKVEDFDGAFYDDSLMPMSEWREKHRAYAKREAAQAIESLKTGVWTDPRKAAYYKLPRYFRAFAYFCIRYFLKGGILDGYAGWMWNFWQGLWYRLLVDREIGRMK